MSWFLLSVVCMLGWGSADLFYKLGTDEEDRFSHLKLAVWVGLVMGAVSVVLLIVTRPFGSAGELFLSALRYAPASLSYIISMVIGYAGLRYLELSIVSPVQNASGALSAVCMLVYFGIKGQNVLTELSVLDIAGTAVIVLGVIALAVVENRLSAQEPGERKYRFGALALLFPLLYCVFDTIGTAADGIILTGDMDLGEIEVLILYGFTFLLAGAAAWLYLLFKTKKPYNPFARHELTKGTAALCEEAGQVFYVYAMASRPVLAAPMVASYCIVSVLLSRVFAGEKLKKAQYLCVLSVICGIVLLGVSEGLSEL